MTLLQIDGIANSIGLVILLIVVCCIVLPVSVYLCVKMGTAAFCITRNRFSKRENRNVSTGQTRATNVSGEEEG